MRLTLVMTAALLSLAMPAGHAVACASIVPADIRPGETDQQRVNRGLKDRQDELRRRADSVFVAQVSAARMTGLIEADFTLTPVFALYDSPIPDDAVTRRGSLTPTCEVAMALGQFLVVYAERSDTGWRTLDIVQTDRLQDPPADFRHRIRDYFRGLAQTPVDPD